MSRARCGRRVVRLKGGDPYVFGRGGEEVLALRAAGVEVRVVPGVSSALSAPALAGIPVTHRGVSAAVTVVTGHRAGGAADRDASGTDWAALAAVPGTLVVLMAATTAGTVAAALIAGGRSVAQPAAVVHAAGTVDQQVVRTDLAGLASRGCPLAPPCVLVIGDVARPDLLGCAVPDPTVATVAA